MIYSIDDLKKQRSELVIKRDSIAAQIRTLDTQISKRCNHVWVWNPIAGDGRYCTVCGIVDIDCDDQETLHAVS